MEHWNHLRFWTWGFGVHILFIEYLCLGPRVGVAWGVLHTLFPKNKLKHTKCVLFLFFKFTMFCLVFIFLVSSLSIKRHLRRMYTHRRVRIFRPSDCTNICLYQTYKRTYIENATIAKHNLPNAQKRRDEQQIVTKQKQHRNHRRTTKNCKRKSALQRSVEKNRGNWWLPCFNHSVNPPFFHSRSCP